MALIGINQPQRKQSRSRLETINQGLEIINNTLGLALAIPKYMQEKKVAQAKQTASMAQAETARAQEGRAKEKFGIETRLTTEGTRTALIAAGMPPDTIPQYESEALKFIETPAQKESRAYREGMLGLAVEKGGRETRKAIREEAVPVMPGQIAVDKKFGDDYAEFIAGGGRSQVEKNFTTLDDVHVKLLNAKKDNKNYTGYAVGSVPREHRAAFNPESADMEELVAGVVQQNLRLVLGGQFAEREGENLIRRAYNPRLEEADNARRVESLIKQMKGAYESKLSAAKYFETNGTLRGWKGTLITSPDQLLADEKDADIEEYAKKFGLTYEQAKRIIQERQQ